MNTTPTGIPFVDCDLCGRRHPANRSHCMSCNRPSVFLDAAMRCVDCRAPAT